MNGWLFNIYGEIDLVLITPSLEVRQQSRSATWSNVLRHSIQRHAHIKYAVTINMSDVLWKARETTFLNHHAYFLLFRPSAFVSTLRLSHPTPVSLSSDREAYQQWLRWLHCYHQEQTFPGVFFETASRCDAEFCRS